ILDVLAQLRPIFLRRQHRHDFEINQIIPATGPQLESIHIHRLHYLETPSVCRVYPTCVVDDTFRQHPSITDKAFSDRFGVASLEYSITIKSTDGASAFLFN
ncbi:MAG: hypothetical protein ACRDRT_10505, partial [Pseudonocardiaceae bacterium]